MAPCKVDPQASLGSRRVLRHCWCWWWVTLARRLSVRQLLQCCRRVAGERRLAGEEDEECAARRLGSRPDANYDGMGVLVVDANNTIHGGCLRSCCISLTSGGAGHWVTDPQEKPWTLRLSPRSWDYRCQPPCLANSYTLVETGFCHVGQAGLELLSSSDKAAGLDLPKCWDYRHEPPRLAPLLIFNPHPSTVLSCNCEYNSFFEFCNSLQQIVIPERALGTPRHIFPLPLLFSHFLRSKLKEAPACLLQGSSEHTEIICDLISSSKQFIKKFLSNKPRALHGGDADENDFLQLITHLQKLLFKSLSMYVCVRIHQHIHACPQLSCLHQNQDEELFYCQN
ncbi:LOW QUALITY PROTEIN: putative uncharacterized protein FLJ45256 [Gorilla gorilla gorilla]|uniref:LOW QUALITY PROTEIN: putative uncharacterized protein FLJ45256 n=1 Tax=Gorilla gorilla gorilla TaxID=9595 RepID=UPI00300B8D7F